MSAAPSFMKKLLADEKKVTIGGDPELFLVDSATKKIVPSCGLIGGEKGAGVRIKESVPEYTWHEDNVTVEFNFPPVVSPSAFIDNVTAMRDVALTTLQPRGFSLAKTASYQFKEGVLEQLPKAMVMGCEPDFCAYDKKLKRDAFSPKDLGRYRFCGGHIHIGLTNEQEIPAYALAMFADAYIALPFLKFDKQGPRRKFYGRAGLYRAKSYGIEYRTMGNWWATGEHTDPASWMAEQALSLFKCIDKYPVEASKMFSRLPFADIQKVIDSEDRTEAWRLFATITKQELHGMISFHNPAYTRLSRIS